jgi:5-methylcytosine-specific restriction endonuclease McrA
MSAIITVTCHHCGNEFARESWKLGRYKDDYCSPYCCQCCSKVQKKGRALDVHHIIPFRVFGYIRNQNDLYKQANDLTNLITLCQQCHAKAEAQLIPIQPTLLSA